MRHLTALALALTIPASAAAHSGPHTDLQPLAGLVHMLVQHAASGLAGALVAALLVAAHRYTADRRRRMRIAVRDREQ